MSPSTSLAVAPRLDPSPAESEFSLEITDGDGAHVLIVAERLPRGTRVKVRSGDARRMTALLGLAGAIEAAPGEPVSEEPEAGRELCSAHFVSGAGWAWRVTAALVRSRADDAPSARGRRA